MLSLRNVLASALLVVPWIAAVASAAEIRNPRPRPFVVGPELHRWDFQQDTAGWRAVHDCEIKAADGVLRIQSTGRDPYLAAPVSAAGGELAVRLKVQAKTGGFGQFFWSSTKHPGTAAERHCDFRLIHDGQWHEYTVPLPIDGDLTALRLDPGTEPGEILVDSLALHRGAPRPVDIAAIEPADGRLRVTLDNRGAAPQDASVNGVPVTVPAKGEATVEVPVQADLPLAAQPLSVRAGDWPAVEQRVWSYRADAPLDHPVTLAWPGPLGLSIQAARDGSVVRLLRDGRQLAALAPLVHQDGRVPALSLAATEGALAFRGEGIQVTLAPDPQGDLAVRIESTHVVEGPVVRVFGSLEQGLLAGLEYLGKGEASSTRLDIETDEAYRAEPDPLKVTMPLAAFVTDAASVALSWEDMSLQPTFATPDFLDYAPGHRMALKGRKIHAVLRVGEGWQGGGRLEDAILWAVKRRELPPLPALPRTFEAQMQLSLAAYSGMVHDAEHGGWFHAVVPGSRRMPQRGAPLGDCASAIWRITGTLPEVPELQLGGAHVENSAGFFVAGQAERWLRIVNGRAEQLRKSQRPDGSYRYDGPFRRGHFEDTASGICALPAHVLLEHAWGTGNPDSQAAGLKALEFLRRFRTPRGAQTWEVPLHTPDILASAHAVWACVRAFELTGDRRHLEDARRWALTGLPFVYQWSNQPIMRYATVAVYGATHWRGPNWMGLPVQWCGTVYAYALLLLEPYDQTLEWRKLAEGILRCGEQMQYPDGPSKGCLPDVFDLPTQQRRPADINPGALVSLRLRLAGQLDALAVARSGSRCVVAPFPVEIRGEQAVIQARAGVQYQVLIDGRRIITITSQGTDSIPLQETPAPQ